MSLDYYEVSIPQEEKKQRVSLGKKETQKEERKFFEEDIITEDSKIIDISKIQIFTIDCLGNIII